MRLLFCLLLVLPMSGSAVAATLYPAFDDEAALMDSLVAAHREKLIDPLSGLWNRKGLDDLLEREISRATRGSAPLAVAMIDIDHFKRINDTFGHPTGDRVISEIASICHGSLRREDIVGRYGGEEFIAVLPNLDSENALNAMERLRSSVEETRIDLVDAALTVSIGVTVSDGSEAFDHAVDRADRALYAAKRSGRNKVVVE